MKLHRPTFRIAAVGLGLAVVVSLVAGPALAGAAVLPVTAANSTVRSSVPPHGTVDAWGYNVFGQVGNGTTTDSRVPVRVHGLTGVIAIAGGEYTGYALRVNGTVYAWGDNYRGQLGNGTTAPYSRVPVRVGSLTHITAIAGGAYAGYALRSDGTVYAWGANNWGQLGHGTTTDSHVPVRKSVV